jgi:hypothetical protein
VFAKHQELGEKTEFLPRNAAVRLKSFFEGALMTWSREEASSIANTPFGRCSKTVAGSMSSLGWGKQRVSSLTSSDRLP